MQILDKEISEVKLVINDRFYDPRGFFSESFNINKLKEFGIDFKIVQENIAFSIKKGTIRGIHFQNEPYAQAKLVRCTKGKILDIAVDLRKGSPTFGKYVSEILDDKNGYALYIPRGFGHLAVSLTKNTILEYFVDNFYNKNSERNIIFNDKNIGINFPIKKFVVSEKDKEAKTLMTVDCNFIYKEKKI